MRQGLACQCQSRGPTSQQCHPGSIPLHDLGEIWLVRPTKRLRITQGPSGHYSSKIWLARRQACQEAKRPPIAAVQSTHHSGKIWLARPAKRPRGRPLQQCNLRNIQACQEQLFVTNFNNLTFRQDLACQARPLQQCNPRNIQACQEQLFVTNFNNLTLTASWLPP